MKFKFGIISIIVLLIVFLVSHVYAMDLFLSPSSSSDESSEASAIDNGNEYMIENEYSEEESPATTDVKTTQESTYASAESTEDTKTIGATAPTVTSTSTVQDNSLSISDIINIILIAVCIVLILLAIAILIRCK